MYVLPYGQMSLWGATVITNLMSAIPWIGQDIVEFIWGGFNTLGPYYGNIILKILLDAGKSPNLEIVYNFFLIFILTKNVKITRTWGQSAEVRSIHTSKASQRLDAGDPIYAYLVGLYEGDGFFTISKNGEYLTYELGIELSIRDVNLIYKINDLLGIGVISFRRRRDIEMVSLRIRNKNDLKNIIIPIFDKYPMLSNKQYDYLRFKNALLSNIIYSKDLKNYTRDTKPLNSIENIINTSYFSTWLVGFIEAEGCFSTYQSRNYWIASFDIAQKDADNLIKAIKEYLSFTTAVYIDNTNCSRLKVSGVRSIENIVKFLSDEPVKLMGYKKLQYQLWLNKLRTIPRYSEKIDIPSNY